MVDRSSDWYSLEELDKLKAPWNFIFGRRSNGKTTRINIRGVDRFFKYGYRYAVIRRNDADFRYKKNSAYMFNALCQPGVVEKYPDGVVQTLSKGKYNSVVYSGREWRFASVDKTGKVMAKSEVFAMAFSLNVSVHDKGLPNLNFGTILFDEAIANGGYLVDEFVTLCNLISTIIRDKSIATIYLVGNTVNMYCPYFREMGLKHVRDMEVGQIQLYRAGDGSPFVAVEYTSAKVSGMASDKYFAFDNPKLAMISTGAWEIQNYPRCPVEYRPIDILYTSYLHFDDEWYKLEIVGTDELFFLYVSAIEDEPEIGDDTLVYDIAYHAEPNYTRNMLIGTSKVEKQIYSLIRQSKVFYEDNFVGEAVRNYVLWCSQN